MKQRENNRQPLYRDPDPQLYSLPLTFRDFNGMPYRQLGQSGLRVSNVGLGTWKMGYPETGDGSRIDEKSSLALLTRAAKLGVTFWDTANRYNNASGNSERIIGSWFKSNPSQRRDIILCTKLSGAMDGKSPNHCGLSRQNILESVYASLERLNADYIDVLYFHLFDAETPPDESLAAVEDLIRQDLVRYFAVSNFTVEHLRLYEFTSRRMSVRSRILAVQNQYDLLFGEPEAYKGVLSYCAANRLSYIAWSPMARGLLTERYLEQEKIGPGHRLFDEGAMAMISDQRVRNKIQSLAVMASDIGLPLSQMVIAYVLTLEGMGPVIAASSNIAQLESNAAAGKISLTQEQLKQVKALLDK